MVNDHIKESLLEYCLSEIPPQYAIMLRGRWGSGKTWFIENFVKELNRHEKKELYVSLYGIKNATAIEDEFYRKLHPILSHKGMEIAGKILKGALKASLKIDIDGDGKPDATINASIPNIQIPDYLSGTESHILIFDDLERCPMEISELLGYINHFVEHQNLKVILIANEEEINKKGDSYKSTREKLIGKTFEIKPDIDNALDEIIKETQQAESLEPLIETIKITLQQSGYKNLRHLRQALLDFARLEQKLPETINSAPGLLDHLLRIFLILSIEFRHGNLRAEDIINMREKFIKFSTNKAIAKNAEIEEPPAYKILKKYDEFFRLDMLMDEEIWIEIIDEGYTDVKKIVDSLNKTKYILKDGTPKWAQLWNFRTHTDDEFIKLIDEVFTQLKNKEVGEVNEVKHIYGMLSFFSDCGISKITKDSLLENSISCINEMKKAGKLKEKRAKRNRDNVSAYGMGYINHDTPDFQALCKKIENIEEEAYRETFTDLANDLLSLLALDPEAFSSNLDYSTGESKYADIPILNSIPVKKFVETLLSLTPEKIHQALNFLGDRYGYNHTSQMVFSEFQWIASLRDELTKESIARKGYLSGFCLENILAGPLNTAIEQLTHASQKSHK